MKFNSGKPLQQQTGPDAMRPSWARRNPAGEAVRSSEPINAPSAPRGAIDVTTGEYTPAAGGVIDPQTGTFHQEVGSGCVTNTKTGEFSPKIGP